MKQILQHLNSRTLLNIGLFALILVLVLVLVFEPGKEPEIKPRHLTELTQADITHIDIKRTDATDIKLKKNNGVWFIIDPYQLPANEFRVQSVAAMAVTKSFLQYDIKTVDLKKFKLDKPEITVILNNNISLEVGGVDPINNRRYVKNGDTLHLVSDTFYYQVVGAITAYISYQLLPPDIKLNKLVLPKFTLSQQNGDWQMNPAQQDASADSINEFVDEWRHAQSLEISEYKGAPQKANIHIYPEGMEKPIEFSLQKLNDSIFLIRNDLKLRYKLSDEIAEKLQKLPEPIEPIDEPVTEQTDNAKQPAK